MPCSTEAEQEKLPTASAVVADVVDCAKHLHRNIMMSWSGKRLELMDVKQVESRFFVRKAGSLTATLSDVEAIFGPVEPIGLADVTGEFAFITPEMNEGTFKKKKRNSLEDISARIPNQRLIIEEIIMKYIVVLGDGMADEPIAALDNQTPLQYAKTPMMDELSKVSEIGLVHTIPKA